MIPWSFKYRYECSDPDCNTHIQSIIDWEIAELYRCVLSLREHERPVAPPAFVRLAGLVAARSPVVLVASVADRPDPHRLRGRRHGLRGRLDFDRLDEFPGLVHRQRLAEELPRQLGE